MTSHSNFGGDDGDSAVVVGTVAGVGDGAVAAADDTVIDGTVADTGTVKKQNFRTGLDPVSRTNNSAQPTEFSAAVTAADKVRCAQLFSLDTGSSPVWSAVAGTDADDDDRALVVGTVATVSGGVGDGAVATRDADLRPLREVQRHHTVGGGEAGRVLHFVMRAKIILLLGVGWMLAGGVAGAKEYAAEVIVFERPGVGELGEASGRDVASGQDAAGEQSEAGERWDFSSQRIKARVARMAALADEVGEQAAALAVRVAAERNKIAAEQDGVAAERGGVVAEVVESVAADDAADDDDNIVKNSAGQVAEYEISAQLESLAAMRRDLLDAGYRVLNATRWRQPTSFFKDAPVIALGDTDGALAGFVRVYTTSLIYADLHLQLSPPVVDDTVVGDVTVTDDADAQPHYFIFEKRRLKFKQVHYFDHPLFGAILGVWEVEETDDAENESPL